MERLQKRRRTKQPAVDRLAASLPLYAENTTNDVEMASRGEASREPKPLCACPWSPARCRRLADPKSPGGSFCRECGLVACSCQCFVCDPWASDQEMPTQCVPCGPEANQCEETLVLDSPSQVKPPVTNSQVPDAGDNGISFEGRFPLPNFALSPDASGQQPASAHASGQQPAKAKQAFPSVQETLPWRAPYTGAGYSRVDHSITTIAARAEASRPVHGRLHRAAAPRVEAPPAPLPTGASHERWKDAPGCFKCWRAGVVHSYILVDIWLGSWSINDIYKCNAYLARALTAEGVDDGASARRNLEHRGWNAARFAQVLREERREHLSAGSECGKKCTNDWPFP
jgi:hypothetical protein